MLKSTGGMTLTPYGGFIISREDVKAYLDLGCRMIRITFNLPANRIWDTSLLDMYASVINYFRAKGIITLALFTSDIVPSAAQDQWNNDGVAWQKYKEAYLANLTTITAHCTLISAVEIWNEANVYWHRLASQGGKKVGGTYITPERYAELLHASVPIVRKNLPRAMICSSGMFMHNIHGELSAGSAGADYIDAVYRYYKTNNIAIDFNDIAIHPYLDQGGNFNPLHFETQFNFYKNVLTKYNDPERTFYITETGWDVHHVTEALQASNLEKLLGCIGLHPEILVLSYFEYKDSPFANLLYGLADIEGSARPSFCVFKNYAGMASSTMDALFTTT